MNELKAYGGGDYSEYAFSAMLEAFNYSFIDRHGLNFTPMYFNSEMIVITDATSKLPELRETVKSTAIAQGVSIHFILSQVDRSYYEDIANATGGIVYDDHHTTWSILQFESKHSDSAGPSGRKRRSASANEISISVSRLVYSLRVSILAATSTGVVSISLPDGSVESASIEDSVMFFWKSDPLPGQYLFTLGASVQDTTIQQDVNLDVNLFYLDSNSTISSANPPPACKFNNA